MAVRGGDKLKRHLAQRRKLAREVQGKRFTVGIHDPRIGALAAQLEYGNPASNLPERPAFRAGIREAEKPFKRDALKVAKAMSRGNSPAAVQGQMRAAVLAAKARIVRSYQTFHGAPLSEAQEARKAGTPGEGRQLVGHRGERLIEHIEAHDEAGNEVD